MSCSKHECQACGECCKWLDFNVGRINQASMEFFMARGLQIFTMGDYLMVRVPHRCAQLNERDQCAIYPSRPESCRKSCCCRMWKLGPHSKQPMIVPILPPGL